MMANEPMTPGQLAFVTYLRALAAAGYAEFAEESDWDEMLDDERESHEAAAEAVRKQMLDGLGIADPFYAAEADSVIRGLAAEYPNRNGPIGIVDAMLSEVILLRAFKARVEAGVKP